MACLIHCRVGNSLQQPGQSSNVERDLVTCFVASTEPNIAYSTGTAYAGCTKNEYL
jgi:hypothetical protein